MTKNDFAKIGLGFAENDNYNTVVVGCWKKFFPQINLPTESPLVELAKECWHALIGCQKCHIIFVDIRVRGTSAVYYKNRYRLDITETTEKDFLETYCPYNADDMRRYAWLSILNQFDYAKICDDILETLTNIIRVKND